jgi:kinetochore protein Nuf2
VERALGDLMRTCGISDFSMMDVLKPEAKRTRENLSAVINFAKFRETTLGAYQEV